MLLSDCTLLELRSVNGRCGANTSDPCAAVAGVGAVVAGGAVAGGAGGLTLAEAVYFGC